MRIDLEAMTFEQRNDLRRRLSEMDKCPAVVWRGPGHQSKGHCSIKAPHEGSPHYDRGAEWTGDEGYE